MASRFLRWKELSELHHRDIKEFYVSHYGSNADVCFDRDVSMHERISDQVRVIITATGCKVEGDVV